MSNQVPIQPKGSSEPNGQDSNVKKLGLFSVIVTELIAYTGVGFGLGYLAWAKWGAPWWVLLTLSMAGLILAFYRIYQISQKEL